MRGFWPLQTDDETGITDYLNDVSKYVVSSTMHDPEWARTTVLRGAMVEEVQALKSEPGCDIVTTGSIILVHDLIAAGLVEEYRLFVFAGAREVPRLKLTETRPFRGGVVLLRYRTA